eukprot:3075719-Pleurochrysis_carterae.AAC.2
MPAEYGYCLQVELYTSHPHAVAVRTARTHCRPRAHPAFLTAQLLLPDATGATYLDKTANEKLTSDKPTLELIELLGLPPGKQNAEITAEPPPLQVGSLVKLQDSGAGTELSIQSTGWEDTVVWNPYGNGELRESPFKTGFCQGSPQNTVIVKHHRVFACISCPAPLPFTSKLLSPWATTASFASSAQKR